MAALKKVPHLDGDMAMKTVTYFRASLLVPLLAPLMLMPFGDGFAIAILYLSLAFGGAQYACFALFLFIFLGKLRSVSKILYLAISAPILFIPVQYAGWVIFTLVKYSRIDNFLGILPMAFYTTILGYSYVSCVFIAYGAFRSKGWIDDGKYF